MKWLIFHLYLKPLIVDNYAKRKAGELPDEWFWADTLAVEWGYAIDSVTGKGSKFR